MPFCFKVPNEHNALQSIDVILIGDIHFPQSKLDLDYKDDAISAEYAASVSTCPLRPVIDQVARLGETADAIMFCGDLTTLGDVDGYQECVDWLERSLQLKSEGLWKHDRVHVVPGNHDVDRKACTPGTSGTIDKFKPFVAAWKKHGLDRLLALEKVRSTCVTKGRSKARLLSLNSCLGCGEFRGLPAKIRDVVVDELEPLLSAGTPRSTLDAELKSKWETLDSPAFVGAEIEELRDAISSLDDGEIPIVLSHHNILPQKTVRVALYTELINSGTFRYEMASHASPVVYLHGHIHADPIEVVTLPEPDATPLICVSAPELRHGFILVRIAFATRGLPLGLEVVPYRSSHGNTRCEPGKSVRIPFWKPTALATRCSISARKVFAEIELSKGVARFGELRKQLESLALTDNKLSDALEELEWLGLIEISNRNDTRDHWQISGAA